MQIGNAPRFLFILSAAWLFLPVGLWGQKAEPNRIAFSQGASSAVVQGELQGAQQAEYVIGARGKQTVTLQLAGRPDKSLSVELHDPENQEIKLNSTGNGRHRVMLPKDGDYEIWVVRKGRPAGVSKYRLTVAIR